MAIGWMTALKVIPWGQVIEHAPTVLKEARRLMDRQRGEAAPASPGPGPVSAAPLSGSLEKRVARLETELAETRARLQQLGEQQRQGDELLAALAEQNARLVEAVNVMRLRLRLLLGAVALLTTGGVLLAWRVLGG